MRLISTGVLLSLCFILFLSSSLSAQTCFNTGLNGTVIDLPCNQNCVNIPVRIPHLKSTDDYKVVTIPYNPYPYVTAAPALTYPGCPDQLQDDKFYDTTFLPFKFCYFGAEYTKLAVSTNGVITFDSLNALQGSNWQLSPGNQLPFGGAGTQGTGACPTPNGTLFPRAAIMGAYYDIDISDDDNFPNRKMEVRVEGTAPCRRFVVSYFEIPLFSCTSTQATQQIVLHESTGLIDVYIGNKPACSSWNDGLAILGIQNWDRTRAVTAPGKNCTQWSESNTAYQFVPSGGASRFVKCEVFTLAGALIATGDTITTTEGFLDVSFPNFCPAGATTQYVVRTTFAACDNSSVQLVSQDTITINKTNALNATATTTATSCGVTGSGTATATVPAGVGTAPYTFVLNPGGVSQTGSPGTTFTGLTAGNYTINVTDASGGCTSTIPITITSTGVLNVTFTTVNTTCAGANNGSITVNPPNGTPPISYSINGGPYTSNNVFSNLAPGTYFMSVQDNAGCQAIFVPVTVAQGSSTVTGTVAVSPTSCAGVNNGTITVTPTAGSAPYEYSINGGSSWQSSNTFSGLAPGSYNVIIRSGGVCISGNIPATIAAGTGLTGTLATAPTTCAGVNNGSITVTPSAGTAPFTIVLDGTVTQTGNPTTTFNGVSAGPHSVTITDVNGCTTTTALTATVAAGSGYTATFTATATSCLGATNGSITITPQTPGTGPYTFVLNPGSISQTGATNTTFNGLAAGNYSVLVTDAAGCQATVSNMNVAQGNGLTATTATTATSCPGVNNGSITVTPTTGTAPFTIVLDGTITQTGNPSTTFTSLPAGAHTVTITDATGCTTSTAITANIATGTGYTATFTATGTSCFGVNNGSITVTPQAPGTGPYTFVLDPGNITQTGATNTTFNGLAPGTYSVSVTDAAGCQTSLSNMTVTQGNGLQATWATAPTTCAGVNNGTIEVTPTNGTAPFTIVMDGVTTQVANPTTIFTGLSAGPHSFTITDANGCTTSNGPLSATVNAGSGYTATFAAAGTSCLGATNGSITITPQAPGASPYTFVLTPGAVSQTGATTTFNNIGAGTYSVLVTDANGCQTTVSNINVTEGAGLTATLTPTATTCAGATNGSIAVAPTNGTAPYTFVLDGTVTQTGATTTFNNLASGPHTVTITDANGCTTAAPINTSVTAGAGFTANFTAVPTACVGVNNGGITITPQSPGVSPYTFVLNPGAITQTGAASTSFTNLAPGTYSALVTDAAGCQTSLSNMVVTQGSGIQANLTPAAVTCFGSSNGSIAVTPTNGTGPYTFVLNPGNITQTGATGTTFSNLAAASYTISITDAAGCVSTALAQTISQPAALTAPTPSALPVACNGGNNGQISVSPAGGTAPYSYSIDNVNFQPANTFNLSQGTYTVYVRDANGCALQFPNIQVLEPPVLTGSLVSTSNATCGGGSDGVIEVAAAGGTPGYQYSLNGTAYQASSTFNVVPGTYSVIIRDANNCVTTVPDIIVGLTDNLSLTATDPAPICEGSSVQLQTTSNAATYTWSPATGLSSASVANPVASPTVSTAYTVTAVLGNCTTSATINVQVLPAPIPDAGAPANICYGQDAQLSGSGGVTYSWTPVAFLDDPTSPNPNVIEPDKTTTYTLSVVDANGCPSLVTDNVVVNVTPPIKVNVSPVDTIVHAGAQFQLLAQSVGTDYEWSPAIGLNDPYIPNPVATGQGVGSVTTYQVRASTSAGCEGFATVTIKVYTGPEIYVPTAFTPNGDGMNDVFYPVPVGIKKLNYFRVFNRWGQVMYATTTFNKGWDGRMGGKEQASGVYVWMVQGTTENGQVITKQGTVTLVR